MHTVYTHTHTQISDAAGGEASTFLTKVRFHTMSCNAVFSRHVLICLSRVRTQYTHTHTQISDAAGGEASTFLTKVRFHTMSCNAVFSRHVLICLSRVRTQYTHTHIHRSLTPLAGTTPISSLFAGCLLSSGRETVLLNSKMVIKLYNLVSWSVVLHWFLKCVHWFFRFHIIIIIIMASAKFFHWFVVHWNAIMAGAPIYVT